MMYARPPKPLASPAIRASARGRTCTVRWHGCDGGGDTTVLAHIRGIWSGVAQKPSDLMAVYACFRCHDAIDRRSGEPVPAEELLRALNETHTIMLAEGLISARGAR